MAFHIVQCGVTITCDTAEDLRAILPSSLELIQDGPKSRARKPGKRGRKKGSKNKTHGMARLWLAARAYAEHNKLPPRQAFKAVCASPRKLMLARKLAGQTE